MTGERRYVLAAVAVVAAITAVKAVLAAIGGLGDSEALYASYSLHPQGGYLDHPPMIGWIIRATTAVGGRSSLAVRASPILLFCATAWLVFDLARRLGGGARGGLVAVCVLCFVPITFVGGLAATPDAPAAAFWMLAAWLLVVHVERGTPDRRPVSCGVLVGLALGLGMLSKYTGVLLVVAFVAFVTLRRRRWWASYMLPAVIVAAACTLPVIVWNAEHGWASAMHRLVWTQQQAGVSLRNAGALAGGQLLYMSPVIMVLVVAQMVRWWRAREREAALALALVTWVPAAGLWALCLWSSVAEPHWPTLAYLPAIAGLGAWSTSGGGRTLCRWTVAGTVTAAVLTAVGLTAAATPLATRWGLTDPVTDITNELYGWERAARKVREVTPGDAVVVGPHWTVCAQLEWRLHGEREVACVTVEQDDFDVWNPVRTRDPDVYPRLYYVTDDRWRELDGFILTTEARLLATVEVERGGRTVRTFRIYRR